MKKRTTILILAVVLSGAIASCKKGSFPADQYGASVTLKSSALSTTKMEVQFEGLDTRDSLPAGEAVRKEYYLGGDELTAGKPLRFKVYKAGTDELIADTGFVLQQMTRQTFNVIYSDMLGLSGFLGDSDVPEDSIRVRIRYIDNTAAKRFPALVWECYQYRSSSPYYDPDNNVHFTLTLNSGEYSQDITIPVYMKNNTTRTRVMAKLKDPATGQYLSYTAALGIFDTGMNANNNLFGAGSFYFYTGTLTDKSGGFYNLPYTLQKL